jgi:hypothetical protein
VAGRRPDPPVCPRHRHVRRAQPRRRHRQPVRASPAPLPVTAVGVAALPPRPPLGVRAGPGRQDEQAAAILPRYRVEQGDRARAAPAGAPAAPAPS